jgi:hypothetical protein
MHALVEEGCGSREHREECFLFFAQELEIKGQFIVARVQVGVILLDAVLTGRDHIPELLSA